MNTALLTERIESSSYTKSIIAKSLGLTRQGFYNKLKGLREFKGSEIKKLIQILDLSESDQKAIFFADDVSETAKTTNKEE